MILTILDIGLILILVLLAVFSSGFILGKTPDYIQSFLKLAIRKEILSPEGRFSLLLAILLACLGTILYVLSSLKRLLSGLYGLPEGDILSPVVVYFVVFSSIVLDIIFVGLKAIGENRVLHQKWRE